MTLVLVLRTLEGIAIVSDTLSTATDIRIMDGIEKRISYPVHKRGKIARVGNLAVVHAGVTLINNRTINQIVHQLPRKSDSLMEYIDRMRIEFQTELEKDPIIKQFDPEEVLLSLGVVGYYNDKPFVYRIVFMRGIEDPIDYLLSEDAFISPYYGLDYFGDYHFIRIVIKAAKEENLMKPFEILTIHEAMDLIRALMRFSIDFQRFMVEATVMFPLESAIITRDGFQWIDKMGIKKFHYQDHDDGIPYV